MRTAPLLLFALLTSACTTAEKAPLSATDARIMPPVPGVTKRAAYLTLVNNGDAAISLTSVSSPQFAVVEFHQTIVASGVARMRPLRELVIAAGESVRLEPGGKHLMLSQEKPAAATASADNRVGESIRLDFYSRDDLVLSVNIAGH